ncbi:Fur family transcriptional regulator [Nocardia sp. CDC160]|uniref:Fur family transcriptional regulator n=1 Tax=Nocardia sp. CDC160 TaxID=3112166 RepID=UPI002DBA652F|nr:transcriptional repressor [Nocardia sp. CDC160]MEC3915605.1 transcriptional repressor [Nocardia sp. CDC160]
MSYQDRRSPDPLRRRRRTTPRQRALLELLKRDNHFRSAQQWHAELRTTVGVGLTSVYRILHQFAEQHVVETQRAEDGELLYRLRDTAEHYHNLLCRICGRAERFTLDALEHHTEHVARQYRYADVNHHLDLYGTCPDCAGVAQQE